MENKLKKHCLKMSPAVKATYKFIEQEFDRIEIAMRPLKKHLKYLREIGALEMTHEEEQSLS